MVFLHCCRTPGQPNIKPVLRDDDVETQAVTRIRFPEDLETAEAALEGDVQAAERVARILRNPALEAWLVKRGATRTEATDLVGDLFADCFGGEKVKGGMHRLLGKFNGACRLDSFLRRVVMNRLISLKRKSRPSVSIDGDPDDEDGGRVMLAAGPEVRSEDALVELLRAAVMHAFATVDQERLVLFRLVHSYRVPQQSLALMWGWHPAKVSRALSALLLELREKIMDEVRRADPWLHLQWEDFLELCGETNDLFDY